MNKRLSTFILFIVLCLFTMGSISAEENRVKVEINGELLSTPGILLEGEHVYIPAKAVLEKLGLQVTWDQNTKTISGSGISLTADSEFGKLNNKPVLLEMPPIIINNTFMIYRQTIPHLLMYSTGFDQKTNTLSISTVNFVSVDPYQSYNQKYGGINEFMEVGQAFMGKTNWIVGPVLTQDLSGNPMVVENLSPVWIEKVEKDIVEGQVKLTVKSADKRFVMRFVTKTNIFDQLTFVNPFEANKWPQDVWDKIKKRQIAIGMNKEQVKMSIGKPQRINSTLQTNGAFEQWVYTTTDPFRSNYVYFTNEIVTSIQLSQ